DSEQNKNNERKLNHEKSKLHIHNNTLGAWFLCASAEDASSKSTAGRRLSWREHRGGPERPFWPHHRELQHGDWFLFARVPFRCWFQYRRWRWDTPCQHRSGKYRYRRRSTAE